MTELTLFDVANEAHSSAVISPCGRYRYLLTRTWGSGPAATFVMLNPSTADGEQDDPTIRRCIDYARRWHCGSLIVVNLYAWRATQPTALRTADDPIGPENDDHLTRAALAAAVADAPLVAAWGANAAPERAAAVAALPGMDRLTALAVTQAGQPRHPLYLPATLTPQPWSPPTAAPTPVQAPRPGPPCLDPEACLRDDQTGDCPCMDQDDEPEFLERPIEDVPTRGLL